ncbi:MAG: trans-2-enoyl-CoA reductase family protein [Puniceicoccales bacterium]|jgi:enoyl-[acyl-carrier protein] reductase/trans-2-enoyl-CoA reductase (NAD+)|nr:trans-2-enoyl-CoA reductase family protein [Puniceicoccales bacterium]
MARRVVEPKIRGFICTTAHAAGCAAHVQEQVARVEGKKFPSSGPGTALIIGASTGYGLASRIVATFGAGADSLGVFFERPAQGERTASAGWYNSVALERMARERGRRVWSVNGDAFSDAVKLRSVELLRREFRPVDLVIYSLASPQRTHPRTGQLFRSVLKPVGQGFTSKTLHTDRGVVDTVHLEPASEEEIAATVAVMGGEDWLLWMEALAAAGVLADGVKSVAYGYLGPQLTWPIYRDGTIGLAKKDLERTVDRIDALLRPLQGKAHIAVNKAVVTQASSAIPVVPLYISLLFRAMKERGCHESCGEQMERLFAERLYAKNLPDGAVDGEGRLRLDGWEMDPAVQVEVLRRWQLVTTENLRELGDPDGYGADFLRLFGFGLPGVDPLEPVETESFLETCGGLAG